MARPRPPVLGPALVALFAALLAPVLATAQDGRSSTVGAAPETHAAVRNAVIGPIVGAQAPDTDAATPVRTDATREVDANRGKVLVFFRSADWCPFCKAHLKEIEAAASPLAKAGWALQAVSYDAPDTLRDFAAANDLTYTFLSDPDSRVIEAFNLRNMEVKAGSRADGIPHPAVIFVKADGTIGAVLRERGYKDRPSADALVETARNLNALADAGEVISK